MTCVACGRQEPAATYVVNGYHVERCLCGVGRTRVPRDFEPASIYTESYFQGGQRDGYGDYEGSGAELRLEFGSTIGQLRRHGISRGRILEIGSAYGYFLDVAKVAGYEAVGVELSEHARAAARARGHEVHRELAGEATGRGPFDAVVMLDVIEHIVEPGALLAALCRVLKPGGVMVITTGDFASPLARLAGRRWRLMTPPQHLWFFTAPSLAVLLVRAGLTVSAVDRPWKQVPLQLVAYQAARAVGAEGWVRRHVVPRLPPLAVPVNLFDAMRIVATRRLE